MTGHSVVPIGGAPFVRPYSAVRGIDTTVAPNPSYSSPSSQWSPLSPGLASPPSSSSNSSSPSDSPTIGSYTGSSGSNLHQTTDSQLEAALRYSFGVHEHTRKMWEKERMNIEKQKFEASHNAEDHHHHHSKSPSNTSDAPTRRSSLGESLGVDGIFGRKKRHAKNKSMS